MKFDSTFSVDGILQTTLRQLNGTNGNSRVMAVQPDGKIVLVGTDQNLSLLKVKRLNANGEDDPTFSFTAHINAVGAACLALQDDGKILCFHQNFKIVRLNSTGSIDTTFGQQGFVSTQGISIKELSVKQDGKILAAG